MINQMTFVKLRQGRGETPNVLAAAHLQGRVIRDGENSLSLARTQVREWVQNLIDEFDEHAHLREAKLLVLFRRGQKADADGRTELGRAKKTSRLLRLLAGSFAAKAEGLIAADFIVTVNADWWDDAADEDRLALLDHELTHCAATIAGRFVPAAKLEGFIKAVGRDHIETVDERTDEKGRSLVRYRRRRGEKKPGARGYRRQPLAWRIRKHDVETFVSVLARWGGSTSMHRPLLDVLDPAEETTPLLDKGGQA